MKQITFNKTYEKVETKDPSLFAQYVRQTAEMLERPYMVVFKMVEDWEMHKIIRRYDEAMERTEVNEQQKYWWGKRKWDKKTI